MDFFLAQLIAASSEIPASAKTWLVGQLGSMSESQKQELSSILRYGVGAGLGAFLLSLLGGGTHAALAGAGAGAFLAHQLGQDRLPAYSSPYYTSP